jgi:hypothetical protein
MIGRANDEPIYGLELPGSVILKLFYNAMYRFKPQFVDFSWSHISNVLYATKSSSAVERASDQPSAGVMHRCPLVQMLLGQMF